MIGSCLIEKIKGREILDSRGNPTVEAEVTLKNGICKTGISPSGASTGIFEAMELRDKDKRYNGRGVTKAVENINTTINKALKGKDVSDIYAVDKLMLELDGTENKSRLGANSILAVSIACCKAAASLQGVPLYRFLGNEAAGRIPVPMMNIMNGGRHAPSSKLDIQEFMIVPQNSESFKESLRRCSEVYHSLAEILKERNLSVSVGDEGGFVPEISSDEEAIELILKAIEKAGYKAGADFSLAIDAAASEWKTDKEDEYVLPKSGRRMTSKQLIDYWEKLILKYPISSIEDGLGEEDWLWWSKMTKALKGKVRLVGDDLFVTNISRIRRGIELGCADDVLIKMNQIGTVSETIEAVKLSKNAGYGVICSHRSGETEDTTVADLAVAFNMERIKAGAPCRGERTAKYNRLLRIEEEIFNI